MRRLAAPNTRFMLVARNRDRLTAVAQDLLTRGALAVDTWVMDLDDTAAHREMLAAAAERLGRIDLALIAHGVLGDQQAAEADFEVGRGGSAYQFHLRRFSADLAGKLLSGPARGHAGGDFFGSRRPRPQEQLCLRRFQRRAQRLPGRLAQSHRSRWSTGADHQTGFRRHANDRACAAQRSFASPDQVAHGILKAIERRRDVAYVPWFWAWIMLLVRAIPSRFFKKMNM